MPFKKCHNLCLKNHIQEKDIKNSTFGKHTFESMKKEIRLTNFAKY